MQLGTRLSIASIRPVLCSIVAGGLVAGGFCGRASAQESKNERPWGVLHRAYNTWDGGTGGLFIEDPGGMAEPGAVRLQLGLGIYSGEDFFYDGDEVEQNTQSFTLSVTALEMLEFYAGLQNRGTTTTIPTTPPRTSALHSFADLTFGAKLGFSVTPVVRLGGGVHFLFRSDVGPETAMLDSTSLGLSADAAFDLQQMQNPWPLIIRFNLEYLFDNSANIIEDIEDDRYDSLPSPMDEDDEVAHLVSRVERYGLAVNRVDMLTPALGFELPLELAKDFYLHPLVEYRIGMPINRDSYDCPFFSGEEDRGSNARGADDTCIDDAGVSSWPMTLALGARLVPPIRGVTVLVAFDIGLTGTSTFVRELAPTSPFKAMFAFSYDYDAKPVEPVIVQAPAPPPPPPVAVVGRVNGTIVDAQTSAAVQGVVVAIAQSEHTPLATNVAGRFTTYELPPGEVVLELTHPEYNPGTCTGTIPATGGDVDVACTLSELPTAGSLVATARDSFGGPIAGARVLVIGGASASGSTDADGEARISELAPGEYTARFESEGHLTRATRFKVDKRKAAVLEVALAAKPAKATVTVSGTTVTAKALKFEKGSTVLSPGGSAALAELADTLLRNPPAGRLRVQSDGEEGLALSRALVIKQGLLDLGVGESQVEAVGEPAPKVSLTLVP